MVYTENTMNSDKQIPLKEEKKHLKLPYDIKFEKKYVKLNSIHTQTLQ